MRGCIGTDADPLFNQNFNPLNQLPKVVTDITQVDRDFTASPSKTEMMVVEDFDNETGINSSGHHNLSGQIQIEHKYLITTELHPQRVAEIIWKSAGNETYFEAIWADKSQGFDIHDFATLDFRIGRKIGPLIINPPTDFNIQLEDSIGHLSREISVSDYANIDGPGTINPVLKTVRIPLAVVQAVDLTKIRGIRFNFNKSKSGSIYLANIRMHKQAGLGQSKANSLLFTRLNSVSLNNNKALKKISPEYIPISQNSLRIIHPAPKNNFGSSQKVVEIVLASRIPFPVMDRLPVLNIGSKKFLLSHYSDLSQLKELTFTLTEEQYKSLTKGSEITLSNGKIWEFGIFTNS